MATIRDVARACGVSPMTVSFVINNRPGQVSPETRERVMRMVRELNYRPAAAKESADTREVCSLGVIVGVHGDSLLRPGYYRSILDGVMVSADELGHNITIFNNRLLHSEISYAIRTYCDGRCDGIMVVAPIMGSQMVAALYERGFPLVLIGDRGDEATISCVDVDNQQSAAAVMEHLFALGHRRIAFLGGPEFVRSANERREVYRQAMIASGGWVDDWSLDAASRPEYTKDSIEEMLRRPAEGRPTAFFGWNDSTAVTAWEVATSIGLRAPEDVTIVGIDDLEARNVTPTLTTIRQPYREIGRQAIESLMAQVRGTAEEPQRIFLPGELIVRGSSGPPAS